MEEKIKNEELQSRREFFKKTAQNVLPFLGIVALSPLLTSCDPDAVPIGCGSSCSGSCKGDCAGDCDDNCTADCWNGCNRLMR